MRGASPNLLLSSGVVLDLPPGDAWVLGRAGGADLGVDVDLAPHDAASTVSRWHACLRRTAGGFTVEDLGSLNTTKVNRRRLAGHQPYPLADGDHLELGAVRLIFLIRHDAR